MNIMKVNKILKKYDGVRYIEYNNKGFDDDSLGDEIYEIEKNSK